MPPIAHAIAAPPTIAGGSMQRASVLSLGLSALALLGACANDLPVGPAPSPPIDIASMLAQADHSPLIEEPSTIAVIGDIPYGATRIAQMPTLISAINADPSVTLVAHLGDIKTGSSRCDDSYFLQIRNLFDTFADPFVFTPGDNEWTDCHRLNNGSYTPTERLQAVRNLFFPIPGLTLGISKRIVLSEALDPANAAYVENVMWLQSRVIFATLNLPGSNNDRVPWTITGDAAYPSQAAEQASRDQATSAWIQNAFRAATLTRAPGVVFIFQADFWDPVELTSAFAPVVQQIGTLAAEFGKPVLIIEGNSHIFRVDQPYTPDSPLFGAFANMPVAPNVTRIVVQGSDIRGSDGELLPLEYVRLTVDPSRRAAAVFSWERVQVP
jgi:hypothetical protein